MPGLYAASLSPSLKIGALRLIWQTECLSENKRDAFHKLPYVLVSYVRNPSGHARTEEDSKFRCIPRIPRGRIWKVDPGRPKRSRLAFSIQSWTCRRAVREFAMCDIARVGLGAALVLLAGLNPDDIS